MSQRKALVRIQREARRSRGVSPEPETRKVMEARVGQSLEHVRFHHDARAAMLSQSIGAAAFTIGHHVFFGAGMYAPGTARGDRLIAHELTHVAQHREHARGPASIAPDHSPSEVQARAVAQGGRRAPAQAPAHAGPVIHRQPAHEPDEGGAKPDDRPAAPEDTIRTLDEFVFGSHGLNKKHFDALPGILAEIKAKLAADPGAIITLTGHTDKVGDEKYNVALGQKRAESVKDWLIRKGVPAANLKTESAGMSQPIEDKAGQSGANRRVEVHIPGAATPKQPVPGALPRPGADDEYDKPPEKDPLPKGPIMPRPETPPMFPAKDEKEAERLRKRWEAQKQAERNEQLRKKAEELDKLLKQAMKKDAPLDVLKKGARSVVKAMGLPDWLGDKLIEAAEAGIEKGAGELVDKAVDSTGYDDATKNALKNLIKGMLKQAPPQ
jgi:outer membrane protein OmpA-like peptidoglycan-associated protein